MHARYNCIYFWVWRGKRNAKNLLAILRRAAGGKTAINAVTNRHLTDLSWQGRINNFPNKFFPWNQSCVEACRARTVFFLKRGRRRSSCLLFCVAGALHIHFLEGCGPGFRVTDSPGLGHHRIPVHVTTRPGALSARNEVVTCVKHKSSTKIVPLIPNIIKHRIQYSPFFYTGLLRPAPNFFYPCKWSFLFKVCLWSSNKKLRIIFKLTIRNWKNNSK